MMDERHTGPDGERATNSGCPGGASVSRFTAAGHGEVETLLEVLEQEAEDRRQRRIGRLRRPRLPAGKPGRPSSTTPWLCGATGRAV